MNYEDAYIPLMSIGRKHGFRPDVPVEAEDFFRNMVSTYSGNSDNFAAWAEARILDSYISFCKPPDWLQDPEWPFYLGKPMFFVGQVDMLTGNTPLLNHDASYFVFINYDTGVTKVIIQAG
jgi:hypothetical protein